MDDTEARKEEVRKREELILNNDFNEIPPFMVDHHVKGMQMLENSENDLRHTEMVDHNTVKLATRVWMQGEGFGDDIRRGAVAKYAELMMSHKRKRESIIAEMTKVPAMGEYSPGESSPKKDGIFAKLKRVF
jgi:hypothetical protein